MNKFENCIISGGAGYLGLHLLKILLKKKINIIVIDNFSSGSLKAVINFKKKYPKKIQIIKTDIRKPKKIQSFMEKNKVSFFIHLAAKTDAKESFRKKKLYLDINFRSIKAILKLCEKNNVQKFIFASSAAVYGDVKKEKCKEKQPLKPINPYGLSKALAEKEIMKLKKTKFYILRIFNLAGISKELSNYFQNRKSIFFKFAHHISEKKIKNFKIYRANKNHKNLTTNRDFIHVEDAAKIIVKCIEKNKNSPSQIFNCGTGSSTSINKFVHNVSKLLKKNVTYSYCKNVKGDPASVIADNKKLKKLFLGFKFSLKNKIFKDCFNLSKVYAK